MCQVVPKCVRLEGRAQGAALLSFLKYFYLLHRVLIASFKSFFLAHGFSSCGAHGLRSSEACGILVPHPGTKPTSRALQGRFFFFFFARQILNHWTTRDIPGIALLLFPCGGSSPDWRIWALGEHHSPTGSRVLWLLCLTYKPSMSPGNLLHSANMYECLLGARSCSQSRDIPKSPWG